MIRNPVVDGKFYPGSASELRSMIKSYIDEKAEKKEALGMVVPHAGYIYSGPVAGAVISRVKCKDTVIIMGPNHTGRGAPFSITTDGTWKTPLGEVEIDSELSKQILASSKYLQEDYLAHQYEHSIEVQIPFFQYFKPDIKIVPIILSYARGDVYQQIGKDIATAIKKLKKDVLIVASSDMNHYESHEIARKKDGKAIEAILDLNADELIKRVKEFDISMCGYAPTASLITAAKELGAKKAELVKYQTSGDTFGDYSSVVGYAGIIIE